MSAKLLGIKHRVPPSYPHMKFLNSAFILLICYLVLGVGSVSAFDHSILDSVLKARVSEGRVDYAALSKDPRLDDYLAKLEMADPAGLATRDERLAFWINAYNAYTLKLIVAHYPLKSIRDVPHAGLDSPWDIPVAKVGGRVLTLNHIEHVILRKELAEPRIHYAVVCAAVSCPPLRAEAYVAERLDQQIGEQARLFLTKENRFLLKEKRAELSQIFNWFAADFGGKPEAILRSLAPYLDEPIKAALASEAAQWTVVHREYDWALNAQP
jgi:Protein of unknown function, DUF547